MKKGYIECPFCANEIKEGAKKCQYCKEFLINSTGKDVYGKNEKTYDKINITNECINGIKVGFFGKIWQLIKIIFSIGEKRISKRKYGWINILFMMILALCFYPFIGDSLESDEISIGVWILFILIFAFVFLYSLPKRAHDCGKSGWVLLIPFYAFIIVFTEGDHGENKYGKEPDFLKSIINWLPKKWGEKLKEKINSKVNLNK